MVKLESLTRGRNDHFSTKSSTDNQLAGCYLFTVSNSDLLLVTVGSSRLVTCIRIYPKTKQFCILRPWTWTCDLDLRKCPR